MSVFHQPPVAALIKTQARNGRLVYIPCSYQMSLQRYTMMETSTSTATSSLVRNLVWTVKPFRAVIREHSGSFLHNPCKHKVKSSIVTRSTQSTFNHNAPSGRVVKAHLVEHLYPIPRRNDSHETRAEQIFHLSIPEHSAYLACISRRLTCSTI